MRVHLPAVLLIVTSLTGCTDNETTGATAFTPDCSISNWADACTALASPNESPSKAEIDLGVSPLDPLNVFVAAKDLDPVASNCVWSVGQVTLDGGASWATVYVGGTMEEREQPSHPLFGWECVTDPILAFDSAGKLYYALQAYDIQEGNELPPLPLIGTPTFGSAFFLATSEDRGQTFPTENIIPMAIAEGNLVFHDYPRMVVSRTTDSVSTVWNAVGAAGINPYVVTTRDGGATVGPPTIVAMPDAPRSTVFASGYASGPDGNFYMTVVNIPVTEFIAGGGGPTYVPRLAISADDATSFGAFLEMPEVTRIDCPLENTEFRCGTSNELAIDSSDGPYQGRIYTVWDDARDGNANIYVASSDDAGATWSEAHPITIHANDQFMPRPIVDDGGTVHVLYFDRQYDAGNRLLDATHSWSNDGGATWHHQRLTSTSFDGDLGVHQDGFPFIGDYNGIGASGDHVWFGFPSTITGVAEIAVAHAVRET